MTAPKQLDFGVLPPGHFGEMLDPVAHILRSRETGRMIALDLNTSQ